MTERSDIKKLGRDPEIFDINGEEITIQPLVVKEARDFRKKIKGVINEAVAFADGEDWGSLINLVDEMLGEHLIDLVVVASPELNEKGTEWIENNMTEAQLQELFIEAVQINYPWLKKMVQLGEMGAIYNQAQAKKKQ